MTKRVALIEPYHPGFLSFRESPHMIDLVREFVATHPDSAPQCLLVDGNGRWHPNETGLAVAVGVGLNYPTIGVAKEFMPLLDLLPCDADWLRSQKSFRAVRTVLQKRGDWMQMTHRGRVLGGVSAI